MRPSMEIQLHQLRSFVTVAEELHFGRAALRLGLSQPQVSRHVRALEDALDVPLFVRSARSTTLTDAGAALLADARGTLSAAEQLRKRAAQAGRGGAGRVTVAFVWSTLGAYLAPLVAAAGERHPMIELSVRQLRFIEIIPALRRADIDLSITRPLHEDSEMIEQTLTREPSLLAIPAGDPLAAQESLPLTQLDGLPLIALERKLAPRAYDAVINATRGLGIELQFVQHVVSAAEALALVSAGIGFYRLPASAAQLHSGVVYRELEGAPSRVVLVRRPEPPPPAITAIVELAKALFADAQGASNHGAGALEVSAAGS